MRNKIRASVNVKPCNNLGSDISWLAWISQYNWSEWLLNTFYYSMYLFEFAFLCDLTESKKQRVYGLLTTTTLIWNATRKLGYSPTLKIKWRAFTDRGVSVYSFICVGVLCCRKNCTPTANYENSVAAKNCPTHKMWFIMLCIFEAEILRKWEFSDFSFQFNFPVRYNKIGNNE